MRNKMGFTIIEILTVTAIIAILAAIAMPGFIGWRNNAQLGRAARDVYSSFQKAKMEAVRRNVNCGVEFRTDDYVIYRDLDSSLDFSGPNEEVQTVSWSEYPGVILDPTEGGGSGYSFADGTSGIVFAPDGLPHRNGGGLNSGTVFLTYQGNARQNTITVSTAGNIQIDQTG